MGLPFGLSQVKHADESFPRGSDEMICNQNVNVPAPEYLAEDLEPHRRYAARVACHSSQGPSRWTTWVEMRTAEGGELANHGLPYSTVSTWLQCSGVFLLLALSLHLDKTVSLIVST